MKPQIYTSGYSRFGEPGCLFANYEIDKIKDIHRLIKADDVFEADDPVYGLEKDSHCTILYGFDESFYGMGHAETLLKDVFFQNPSLSFPVIVKGFGLFKNEKYDVLHIKMESLIIERLHNVLTERYRYENEYGYNLHLTLAYLKSGRGKQYLDICNSMFADFMTGVLYQNVKNRVSYSSTDGKVYHLGFSD